MESHAIAKQKTASAYNAAAELFDHPANTFWSRFGNNTVERLGLTTGDKVLDVCAGAGASALPAARKVGQAGRVVAVDLAEKLLAIAQAKAAAEGLDNLEFRADDMLALGYPDGYFDAVVCVFGIFFVPDMSAAVKELWRQVRPGGRLAITTWGRFIRTRQQRALASHSQRTARTLQRLQSLGSDIHPGRIVGDAV
ncbi:class I SAM-dependent methyltransferase [Methylomonas koyamae]|uniref:class I SAM-dependent methyltransferase n=1 Tax=Methylomonas koyamae TaxID=702114 RepID=UPI000B3331DC|nr:class I SAM-dependent methyltransferase [Methylomonas koyamae]